MRFCKKRPINHDLNKKKIVKGNWPAPAKLSKTDFLIRSIRPQKQQTKLSDWGEDQFKLSVFQDFYQHFAFTEKTFIRTTVEPPLTATILQWPIYFVPVDRPYPD